MGAQFIKHKNWDDLATSDWKHLFSMQSNFKKFEEIWRFILLIRSLFRRCARRQNLNVVVWDCIRKYLNDNFHFSGNHHSKNRTDTPFKLFHSPAFAPPAELKQASKMLSWEIPSPLEENPTHTYASTSSIAQETYQRSTK